VLDDIAAIQRTARDGGPVSRATWPMIVLRTPKGWTGPKVVDGLPVEGTWRAHQVPLAEVREKPEHLAQLESWMRSYRIVELFSERLYASPNKAVEELEMYAASRVRKDGANSRPARIATR
jgi:xylulose-5-phosphate/fructose-6-phosphate phosphoketolase